MRKTALNIFWLLLLLPFLSFSQDYLISQGGTINTCSGKFYDSGGGAGNYAANESYSITICSENGDQMIELDFTAFSTQTTVDYLTIYNGPDNTSTGTVYSGNNTNSPGFIVADNTSGCLTIEFVSDGAASTTGWEANISCYEPCQDVTATVESTPEISSSGTIEVDVDQEISFIGSGVFSNGNDSDAVYEWDWGDGTSAVGLTSQKSYPAAGLYNVTFQITDYNDCISNIVEIQVIVGAETPGNPYVSAGDDITLVCETTTQLTAEFLEIGLTTSYGVRDIVYVPPFPFNGLANSVNTNIDDAWDSVGSLPFDFCFFGDTETQFQVGSNGLIRFDVDAGDTFNEWSFSNSDNIPTNFPAAVGEGNIFSPVHDIDPAASSGEEIAWEIIGEAPNRVLAVSYYNVQMYSSACSALLATHMIVLYETTNVIDIYIENKPICSTWQGGVAAIGIQNDAGTQGYSPDGRNSSDSPWETSQEAWRFTPTGESVIEFSWLDSSGNVISTDPELDVNITTTETFTAQVIYTNCNGDIVEVTDDVTVTIDDPPFTVDLGDDQNWCLDSDDIILDVDIESSSATYQWILDGNIITGENDPSITISSPNSGEYSVIVNDQNCDVQDVVNITFGEEDSSFELTATCDGSTAQITGVTGGSFAFVDPPADGAVIDATTGEVTGGDYGNSYGISYTTSGSCWSTTELESTILEADDSSFELTATCDGSTAQITGVTGGTFAFVDPPADGAVINATTGAVTGGDYGSTYNISYTSNDICPTTSIETVIVIDADDPSFALTATCDGATATVTGDPGGTFAFVNPPGDSAIINSSTGEITGGDYGTTYTVEYITNGPCPMPLELSITTIDADDPSFALTATCDGATATVTGDPGGTFAFVNPPGDSAIINSSTGEITGGDYGTTYTVEYITNGPCPMPLELSITTIDADDPSFALTATCDGATATVTGDPGGTFAFVNPPGDSAIINSSTGEITGGDYGTTYTVEYITNGPCPMPLELSITTIDADDPSFALTATCDGATATVTGDPGGTFAFVSNPDGASIDQDDGTITGGSPGTTYTVEYVTNGPCPTTTTNSITILADDSSFALTATCDGATAEIMGLTGGTFSFFNPPSDGAVIDAVTGLVTGGDYGSTYNISYETNGLCPTITTNTIVVNSPPEINNPTPLEVCDDNMPDGFTAIDLTLKNSEITDGNPNYSVYYFISLNDAETATNPLAIPYTNISNPQTIFVRVVNIETGCYATTSLDLVVASAPAATSPSNLEYCDPDADGFGVFTLTDADDEITGGQTGLTVTYHETQADAENNVNAIASPYNNIVAYQQPIYVRVESSTIATSCATYLELLIVVNDVPQIAIDPDPLEVCDDNDDGFALFDLSLSDESVLNGLNPLDFNITYYESAENAENAINPILTPFAYTNITEDTQQVWVRVENTITGCYNTVSLTLIVDELPVLIQPLPLELCDDNNTGDEVEEFTLEDSIEQVLDGQTGISITFYETQLDADDATNPIVSPYTNTSNAQTIYLRGENDITGCYATITLDLRVNPIPSPATPEAIEVCDEDNDGFTFFDIETYAVEIINGELDITLSYYETFANAQNAVEPLVSPYFNIVADSQVIFVRAENDLTGCFNIVEQELVTLPSPVLPVIIEDIVVCDEDYDEITVFDLTQRDDDILGDQTTTDFELTYHETLIDAETGNNPIINTSTYVNLSNPQTIYVRLEDLNNGCVSTGEFDLIVAFPPVIVQPTPLEECDDKLADEITVFDLTLKDDEITAGNLEWTVTYYETEEDAQNATNPIETPEAYTNTSIAGNAANPQTLFVSVANPEGCLAYTTLTIRVLPNPTPSTDAPNIEACDYDNPGDQIEIFDITLNEAYIINGEPGVSIAYYETQEDAEAATNPIVDTTAYTNITLGQQTIYVRVTNDTTGCFTVVTFDIVVNPLPDVSTVEDFIACEINTDGFYDFDLDTVTAQILGSQDPANFTVTYHQTQEDADNGENALVSPYTNLTNPQQLFVNITNDLTTCSIAVPSFSIEVQEGAAANGDGVPIDYIICDNTGENDGIGQFDLTTLNEQVLDGQDAANFTVTYYATDEDAQAGVNPLPSVYENTSNPEVIYIRVDNDTTAESLCYDTTQATLSVNLLPEFTLPESYMACINLNGTELIGPTVMEIDLPSSEYSFEWFDPAGNLAATTPTHVPLMDGTYTAVATNLITGCQASVTTVVNSSSPAEVEAIVTTDFFADEHIIEVTAVGTGNYEYQLDDGPWQTSNTFIGVSAGYHIVTVRDINGCGIGTDQALVIDYPRFFTPNGDGYNDTWHIEGIQSRPLADIYIFDRYGKLLKQLSPLSDGWDGTYNGKLMPSTDYWFTITLDMLYGDDDTLIKTFKGHFSLKR